MPRKGVQGNLVALTPIRELGAGRSINMQLPADNLQRLKVISRRRGCPRQAIAASDIAGLAITDRAAVIGKRDLGYCTEHVFACRLEFEKRGSDGRHNARADKVRDAPLRGRQGETFVGG